RSYIWTHLSVYEYHFFLSSRRRHTRFSRDWSSDVCSSDLGCRRSRSTRPLFPSSRPPIASWSVVGQTLPVHFRAGQAQILTARCGSARMVTTGLEAWEECNLGVLQ